MDKLKLLMNPAGRKTSGTPKREAKKLLKQLIKKPAVLYQLLKLVRDMHMEDKLKILGPYEPLNYCTEARCDLFGESVVEVMDCSPTPRYFAWEVKTNRGHSSDASTMRKAQQEADADLRESEPGWVLIP